MLSDALYNERLLLEQAALDNEQAFTDLFHAYRNKLYSFVYDMTGMASKAEDVVQEVFLRIWQQRAGLGQIDNFNAYLFRMCRNHVIDQLRKAARETVLQSNLLLSEDRAAEDPEDSLLRKEVRQKLQEAIDQLPPQQRRIFLLHRERGWKHQQIADELGLSVSTVQNHLFRALASVREFLNTRYPDIACYLLLALSLWLGA